MTQGQETNWEQVLQAVKEFHRPNDKNEKFIVAVVRDGKQSDIAISGDIEGYATKAAIATMILFEHINSGDRKRMIQELAKI